MSYSQSQIQAAKDMAMLYGYENVSNEDAIKFLDWHSANKIEHKSELEAIAIEFCTQATFKQEQKFWDDLLGGDKQ